MSRWLLLLLAAVASGALGAWTPPPNPDPSAILESARQDTAARRYDDALAKHLWYHQNALKIQPAQYGVRLSFALSYWVELARLYPPAMEALEAERRDAGVRLRSASGARTDFADYAAIGQYLDDEAPTVELFVWLDQHNPTLAAQSYPMAEAPLIKAKRYQLCGKYLDVPRSKEQMLSIYRSMLKGGDAGLRAFAQKTFAQRAATLVALLVINGRQAEADDVAATMLKEWPDQGFSRQLERARKGGMPRQD